MDDLFSQKNTEKPAQDSKATAGASSKAVETADNDPSYGNNTPPELSVSELSNKLKRVVEDEFSFVRVRGEISRVTIARSGHLYTTLKDDQANLDAICWKGTVQKLNLVPEEGMEVICTGRLTTYPGRSNYQIIIETMELAGEGALLKLLEDRRRKLHAEGLFEDARKKKIPLLPKKIGVVTSPTGAVIRDILHRLEDRFPRPVLLWPVIVQGAGAAEQVAKGINGFNSLPPEHRPDLIIVARGGGSLEDLMPFNEEIVVRAAANSTIPLISAVGHETDTTLIDYASDLRAPTPSAAAEKAVPVRAELLGFVLDCEKRLLISTQRKLDHYRTHLQGLGRGLGDPKRLLDNITQRLDHASLRLNLALESSLGRRQTYLAELNAALSPKFVMHGITLKQQNIKQMSQRLDNAHQRILEHKEMRLKNVSSLLNSLSFERVLERGFTLIRDKKGLPVTTTKSLTSGQSVDIHFHDGKRSSTID